MHAAETGHRTLRDARGFTLVEFMIACLITTAVLGGTVMLASQLQQGYATQLDDVLVEQEVRYALDWITRILRSAGSNPYSVDDVALPVSPHRFAAIRIDPDGDGIDDDLRIQADISPPNGILGGELRGNCTEEGEDVTIAHDADALTITREDNNIDARPRGDDRTDYLGAGYSRISTLRGTSRTNRGCRYVRAGAGHRPIEDVQHDPRRVSGNNTHHRGSHPNAVTR